MAHNAQIPSFADTVSAAQSKVRPDIQPAIRNFLAGQELSDARTSESLADKLNTAKLNIQSLGQDADIQRLQAAQTETVRSNQADEALRSRELDQDVRVNKIQSKLDTLQATAKQEQAVQLTPGQKKVDQLFAKTFVKQITGESVSAEQRVGKVKESEEEIRELTKVGPIQKFALRASSVLPDVVRGLITPKTKGVEQDVRSNVTQLLRATLGAQFTQKEGERIFSQTFDPSLPPEVNLKRVERLRKVLAGQAQLIEDAAAYFRQNGTLKGYTGQLPVQDSDDVKALVEADILTDAEDRFNELEEQGVPEEQIYEQLDSEGF